MIWKETVFSHVIYLKEHQNNEKIATTILKTKNYNDVIIQNGISYNWTIYKKYVFKNIYLYKYSGFDKIRKSMLISKLFIEIIINSD